MAPEISWVDLKAADHRRVPRARVQMHQIIRERLRVLGIDPAWQRRSGAARKRRLNWSDPGYTRAGTRRRRDLPHQMQQQRRRGAPVHRKTCADGGAIRSGQHRIDFANASPFELLAFCVASETDDRNQMWGTAGETSDEAQPNAAIRCAPNLTVGPSRA